MSRFGVEDYETRAERSRKGKNGKWSLLGVERNRRSVHHLPSTVLVETEKKERNKFESDKVGPAFRTSTPCALVEEGCVESEEHHR